MANIWERDISILAGNLNLGRSYLITAVWVQQIISTFISNFMTLWKKKCYFLGPWYTKVIFSPLPKHCNVTKFITLHIEHGWTWHTVHQRSIPFAWTLCNIPKFVPYKMMMAVVLSFRLNRTVKKISRTKHCRTKRLVGCYNTD